ncbi:MAG: DNA-3-methyladenine glycosylase [Candidatus Gracilibacteria bacterium]|nr:DNA-3-methyladenine glycosylase [Candidatus Gracilibacteria bacterium]
MKLQKTFFENKDTLTLAKDLLGKVLVRKTKEGMIKGIINETEAYIEEDEASHSYKGKKTKRNEIMFKEHGHIYVYFTYGMYHCINIVSERKGYGSAVLIRSVIPIEGENIMIKNRNWHRKNSKELANGPAKVCLAFDIDKLYNGLCVLDEVSDIFLEDIGYKVPKIKKSSRIGISKGIDKKWRFYF